MFTDMAGADSCCHFQGMPSHRDVARLNDLLHSLAEVVAEAVNAHQQPTPSDTQPVQNAAVSQEAGSAAAEVFLEMSQQVGIVTVATSQQQRSATACTVCNTDCIDQCQVNE